ncbi:cyclin-dependent kinase 5 activator 2b [Alosa sapidissima]|uniref:cyclin-dependent kinase 5 activator 2b n=1 Tax=Alosa sapidissima TaxID=34773 RepID=UPI001C0889A0|nr:cyclin-dependent kinase 5 activator 2b [Alosa sapidissima]
MGTILSISPSSRKTTIVVNGPEPTEKSLKKHSVLESALSFKRYVTSSSKNTKKVNPDCQLQANENQVEQLNNENLKKREHLSPEPVPAQNPPPTQSLTPSHSGKRIIAVQKQSSKLSLVSPRKVIVQASTGELLLCLGEFFCRRCYKLKALSANEVVIWFRNVDRTLLLQGWQDQGFITPASLVFVYLICRETVTEDVDTRGELHGIFLTCLYLAYSYMGNEISYPLSPFIVEGNKDTFWDLSLSVIDNMSDQMMQINIDPHFFTEVFQELKGESVTKDAKGSDLDR